MFSLEGILSVGFGLFTTPILPAHRALSCIFGDQFPGWIGVSRLSDKGIIRHRGKIEAVVNNARQSEKLARREGSLATFIWRYEPDIMQLVEPQSASTSAESLTLSIDFERHGWRFVGPTPVYAFLQAAGLINDHVGDCVIWSEVEIIRKSFSQPGR